MEVPISSTVAGRSRVTSSTSFTSSSSTCIGWKNAPLYLKTRLISSAGRSVKDIVARFNPPSPVVAWAYRRSRVTGFTRSA
jgi:hypothetical protein